MSSFIGGLSAALLMVIIAPRAQARVPEPPPPRPKLRKRAKTCVFREVPRQRCSWTTAPRALRLTAKTDPRGYLRAHELELRSGCVSLDDVAAALRTRMKALLGCFHRHGRESRVPVRTTWTRRSYRTVALASVTFDPTPTKRRGCRLPAPRPPKGAGARALRACTGKALAGLSYYSSSNIKPRPTYPAVADLELSHHIASKGAVAMARPPRRMVSRPKLLRRAAPRYPKEARKARAQGKVVLRLTVGPKGRVVKAVVLRSPHPALSRAAERTAKKLLFAPPTSDGKPTTTTLRFAFRFVLD